MTDAVAILSLLVSVLVLIIQYINQRERRHRDLTQFRSDAMTKLSVIKQRITSTRMHLETARIELRKTKDSDDKYETIEQMPYLIEEISGLEKDIKTLFDAYEAIDTMKMNNSKTLLSLQSSVPTINRWDERMSSIEKKTLHLLEVIYSSQNNRARKAKNSKAQHSR